MKTFLEFLSFELEKRSVLLNFDYCISSVIGRVRFKWGFNSLKTSKKTWLIDLLVS